MQNQIAVCQPLQFNFKVCFSSFSHPEDFSLLLCTVVCTFSCSLTRSRSQDEAFSLITSRMGCQSSERSEPSVTEARTLTRRPLPVWLLGTPRTYRDCFPTSLRGFRYKLYKNTKHHRGCIPCAKSVYSFLLYLLGLIMCAPFLAVILQTNENSLVRQLHFIMW